MEFCIVNSHYHFFPQILKSFFFQFHKELCARNTWQSKILFVTQMFSNYVKNKATMELIFNYTYSLTQLPKLDIVIDKPLKSKSKLIRVSGNGYNLPNDYELSKVGLCILHSERINELLSYV